ncbi:MAG: integrase arm-type DNA-binding domain-containing protein [Proteobacteria bacterium]|nr:integrase arm-type DNA-binding domain-containing protein [Pseudomonadota bacterium]
MIYPSGVRSWVYTCGIGGRKVRWAFGDYPTLSLRDVRERHGAYRDLVKAGIDPKEHEKAQREEEARIREHEARRLRVEEQSTTIRELVAEYARKWAKPRKRSWKEDERQLEKDVVSAWGDLKAKDVTLREVRLLIEAKAEEAPIAANRLLACVRRRFNWAVEQTLHAVFDGRTFRPEGRVNLEPNTRVRIVIEAPEAPIEQPASFLDTARSLQLEGPADWSERFEEYLYDRPRSADG